MADKNLLQHLRDGVRLKELAQQEFVRAMRTGRMIAFVGSYATEELGYPKWSKLLKDLLPRLSSPISNRKMKKLYGALDKTTENSPIDYEILRDWIGIDPDAVGSSESALSDEEYRKGIAKTVIHGDTEIPDDNKTSVSHICDDLNIRKIITLNYDLEFEFHLMPHVDMPDESATDLREKFRNGIAYERDKWVKKRLERVDIRSAYDYQVKRTLPDGRHTISDCFHRERSDRLFEFAIGSPDYDFHIMHLHGRITDPETMVVGYSSYEDLYRRRDVTKLPFEHAMRMLFAGNPVLFVGLGMTEDEVLTALRQFVSDKRPDHIAPHFVIWNAYHGRKVQWKGKVSPEDELRRLRWYRRFGIHLIYDTELGDYFAEAPRKELRLRSSVLSLAKFAQTEVRPFGWKPEQLRGMKCFLPVGGESKVDDSDSWKTGSIVWPVVSDTSKIFMPTFEVAETPNINDRSVREFADNEYLDHILRNGPPIKAFVDAPGTGHGYLANVIKDFVTGKVRSGLLKNDQELIYFQINAGFAWEIDTTFALVSALYDHKLAFDTAIPAEKRSRQAANGEWSSAIRAKIRTQSKGPAGRNIVIVINGADRFFDTSGYPLSNGELSPCVTLGKGLYNMYENESPHPSPVS